MALVLVTKSQVSSSSVEGILEDTNNGAPAANKEKIDWTAPLAVDADFYNFIKSRVDSEYFDAASKRCKVVDENSGIPYPPLYHQIV